MGEYCGKVENPVENVDNQGVFPHLQTVILVDYVYRKLPLVGRRERMSNCYFSGNLPKSRKIFLPVFSVCSGYFGACLL